MKKRVSILGIATIAITMFLNVSLTDGSSYNSDFNLASVIGLASANAEECSEAFEFCDNYASLIGQYQNKSYQDQYPYFLRCFNHVADGNCL